MHCNQNAEGCIVHCFFKERPDTHRVAVHVDPVTIFNFQRNSFFSDRQYEIYFGFRTPLRKMGNIKMWQTTNKITYDTFGDMPRKVLQMRILGQNFPVEGHDFLKPACTKTMVTYA